MGQLRSQMDAQIKGQAANIQQNTQQLAELNRNVAAMDTNSVEAFNKLKSRLDQVEERMDRTENRINQSTFILFQHGLSFQQMEGAFPNKDIMDMIAHFLSVVVGINPDDVPINGHLLLGLEKVKASPSPNPGNVGILVYTAWNGFFTYMYNQCKVNDSLDKWHRDHKLPKYSLAPNRTKVGRAVDTVFREVSRGIVAAHKQNKLKGYFRIQQGGILTGGKFYSRSQIEKGALSQWAIPDKKSNVKGPGTPQQRRSSLSGASGGQLADDGSAPGGSGSNPPFQGYQASYASQEEMRVRLGRGEAALSSWMPGTGGVAGGAATGGALAGGQGGGVSPMHH